VCCAASNIFSLAQTSLLKIPGVKQVLGLPDLRKLRQGKQAPVMAAAAEPGQGQGQGGPRTVQTFAQKPRAAGKRA